MYQYWSLWTSLLFFPLGIYLYVSGYPKPLSILIIILSVVSTMHHTRPYNDGFDIDIMGSDYKDILRFLDIFIVFLLGAGLLYYFHNSCLFWLSIIVAIVIKSKVSSLYYSGEKSICHAFLHLYIIFALLYLSFK